MYEVQEVAEKSVGVIMAGRIEKNPVPDKETELTVVVEPTEQNNAMDFECILETVNESWFGSLAEFIGNISTYWPALLFVGVCTVLLVTFKRRINCSNNLLVEALSKNGKYIKGLFVELNDTKESLP